MTGKWDIVAPGAPPPVKAYVRMPLPPSDTPIELVPITQLEALRARIKSVEHLDTGSPYSDAACPWCGCYFYMDYHVKAEDRKYTGEHEIDCSAFTPAGEVK